MPLTFGFHKQTYDSNVPLYVELGSNRVVNRLTYQVLDETSLKAEMAAEGYTPPAAEIGQSAAWLHVEQRALVWMVRATRGTHRAGHHPTGQPADHW